MRVAAAMLGCSLLCCVGKIGLSPEESASRVSLPGETAGHGDAAGADPGTQAGGDSGAVEPGDRSEHAGDPERPVHLIANLSAEPVCSRDDIIFCDDFDSYADGVSSPSALTQMVDKQWGYWNSTFAGAVVEFAYVVPGGPERFASGHAVEFRVPENPHYRHPGCTDDPSRNEGPGPRFSLGFCGEGFNHPNSGPCVGYEEVHVRYYVKYQQGYHQGCWNHASSLKGCSLANEYDCKTAHSIDYGHRFSAGLEPYSDEQYADTPSYPGRLTLYTYWQGMETLYGTQHEPEEPFEIESGRWYCIEQMVRMNTPEVRDGEHAFWVDGEEVHRVTDMDWRNTTVPDLTVNRFRMHLFIHYSPQVNSVFYDNVVLSTSFIGCD